MRRRITRTTLETMPERYTPPVRLRLEMGRYVLAEDYVRALAGREVLRAKSMPRWRSTTRWSCRRCRFRRRRSGRRSVNVGTSTEPVRNLMLRLTQLFNLTGHPAISMPCGAERRRACPAVSSSSAARQQTDALLNVALACEPQITGVSVARGGGTGGG